MPEANLNDVRERLAQHVPDLRRVGRNKVLSVGAAMALLPGLIGGCANVQFGQSESSDTNSTWVTEGHGLNIFNGIASIIERHGVEDFIGEVFGTENFHLGNETVLADNEANNSRKTIRLQENSSEGVIFDIGQSALGVYNLSSDSVDVNSAMLGKWLDMLGSEQDYGERSYLVLLMDDVPSHVEAEDNMYQVAGSGRVLSGKIACRSKMTPDGQTIVTTIATHEIRRQVEKAYQWKENMTKRLQAEIDQARTSSVLPTVLVTKDPKTGKEIAFNIPSFYWELTGMERKQLGYAFHNAYLNNTPVVLPPVWGTLPLSGNMEQDINGIASHCVAGEVTLAAKVLENPVLREHVKELLKFDSAAWDKYEELYPSLPTSPMPLTIDGK